MVGGGPAGATLAAHWPPHAGLVASPLVDRARLSARQGVRGVPLRPRAAACWSVSGYPRTDPGRPERSWIGYLPHHGRPRCGKLDLPLPDQGRLRKAGGARQSRVRATGRGFDRDAARRGNGHSTCAPRIAAVASAVSTDDMRRRLRASAASGGSASETDLRATGGHRCGRSALDPGTAACTRTSCDPHTNRDRDRGSVSRTHLDIAAERLGGRIELHMFDGGYVGPRTRSKDGRDQPVPAWPRCATLTNVRRLAPIASSDERAPHPSRRLREALDGARPVSTRGSTVGPLRFGPFDDPRAAGALFVGDAAGNDRSRTAEKA